MIQTTHTPSYKLFSRHRLSQPFYSDELFLSVVVWLSLAFYVFGLGFYLDDWNFLTLFNSSADGSTLGLFKTVYAAQPWARMRPAQLFYLAALYRFFGTDPVGYHLTNALVLNVMVVLMYKIMSSLSGSRLLALVVSLVYALLPHYSTDRFWVAAFQANLSMALYFLSLHSGLQSLQCAAGAAWRWRVASLLCLLGSALAYEVTLPIFLLNVLVLWRASSHKDETVTSPVTPLSVKAHALTLLTALALLTTFKGVMTHRSGLKEGAVSHLTATVQRLFDFGYRHYNGVQGLNIRKALTVNYISYGLGLPRVAWRVLSSYSDRKSIVVCAVLGLFILARLYTLFGRERLQFPGRAAWARLTALGLIVFSLGYAIFLTTSEVVLTTTGIDNRTNIAAAVGVAMTFVGAVGWVSALIPAGRLRQFFFCGAVTAICVSGCLIIQSLAGFWAAAYREERQILSEIKGQLPSLAPGSTLLLDEVCCCKGPAVVFRRSWDISGALKTTYKDSSLQGDIVMRGLVIGEKSITIPTEGETLEYPYGGSLLVFNYRHKVVERLSNAEQARSYFQTFSPEVEQRRAGPVVLPDLQPRL